MRRKVRTSVTIEDVAQAAGVSISTVSRVLNNKDDVSYETSDRVKEVIRQMGYTANLAARRMRSRTTGVIGLIMPDVDEPFPIQIMQGVNRAVSQLENDLIVYISGDYRKYYSADRERHYVSLLNNSITDGVIVVTPASTHFITEAPLVAIDPHYASSEYPSIQSTNYEGAVDAMQYLLSLGHQKIGFITGRQDLQSAVARLDGYQHSLRRAGITPQPDWIQAGDFTVESGYQAACNLLALPNRPTAIFAANDQMAFGVYQAVQNEGLSIPDDVSVVGFDNIREAVFLHPTLTTVDQFIEKMGMMATDMLLQLIAGDPLENSVVRIPTELVKRNSCRPPG